MRTSRLLVVSALMFAVVLALPWKASAHAGFVSSTPEPGAELGTAPGVVVLRFTEPLNVRLSRAEVTTPDGSTVPGAVTGPEQISVDLATNVQGVFRVNWTTVSLVDGHTLSGSFAFGAGVPVVSAGAASTATTPQRTDLLIAAGRVVEDIALLLAVGLVLIGRLARRPPPLPWVRSRPTTAIAVALTGSLGVVLGEALAAAHSLSPGLILAYLTTGIPGVARTARPALELGALILAVDRSRWTWVPLASAVVVLAAAGHAAAVDPAWWGIATEAVHVGAAALWAGGILALALQRPPGGWAGADARGLLDRFTPVALCAFAATALAGVLRGVQEVGSWSALLGSSYGVALVVKTSLVVLVVGLSLLAWRRLLVSPRIESGVAVAVVVLAAALAAYPLPPARQAESEVAAPSADQDPAIPHAGDLTLGGHAGTVLVGLTVRPGIPGTNDVFVYTLPFVAGEAASGPTVRLSVDGSRIGLDRCGTSCRKAAVDLSGGERIEVDVGDPHGGIATFDLPRLPAPDGSQALQALERRMHALESYRMSESFSSGLTTLMTTYAFRAPNRMRDHSTGGFKTVWIGGTRYQEMAPKAGWIVQRGGPSFSVPSFIWDYVPDSILAPRIVAADQIDGVPTTVLSFYGEIGGASLWFRLWVDATGLVRRSEMRAEGHFMDERYFAFDAPIVIDPPVIPSGTGGSGG